MLHYGLQPSYLAHSTSSYTSISQPSPTYLSFISRYAAPTPIRIDTADIDVYRARPLRSNPTTCVQREIHRGRSVIRLRTTRSNQLATAPRTPGARLVEKFRIKDPPRATEVLLTEDSPIRNDAIYQVSECKINVSVPIVDSSDNCETVVVPLKRNRTKTIDNNNSDSDVVQVTSESAEKPTVEASKSETVIVALKKYRNTANNDSDQVSLDNKIKSEDLRPTVRDNNTQHISVKIKLRKQVARKQNNESNENILLDSSEQQLQSDEKTVGRRHNDEECKFERSTEIDVKECERAEVLGTSVDILPILDVDSLNKSTNYVQPKQTQIRQNLGTKSIGEATFNKKASLSDQQLTNIKQENCLVKQKESEKTIKLEKIVPKQGKKLKISDASGGRADINSCVKIDAKKQQRAAIYSEHGDVAFKQQAHVPLLSNVDSVSALTTNSRRSTTHSQSKQQLPVVKVTRTEHTQVSTLTTATTNQTETDRTLSNSTQLPLENELKLNSVNNNIVDKEISAAQSETVSEAANRYPCTSSREQLKTSQNSINVKINEKSFTNSTEQRDGVKLDLVKEGCSQTASVITKVQTSNNEKATNSEPTVITKVQTSNNEKATNSEPTVITKVQTSNNEKATNSEPTVITKVQTSNNEKATNSEPTVITKVQTSNNEKATNSEPTVTVSHINKVDKEECCNDNNSGKKSHSSESEQAREVLCRSIGLTGRQSNQVQNSSNNLQSERSIASEQTNRDVESTTASNKLVKGKVKKKKVSNGSKSKNKVTGSKKNKERKSALVKKEGSNSTGSCLIGQDEFEDEGLGQDSVVIKCVDELDSCLDSDWEQVEIEEMEDGVKKKKLIVRKKGKKVTVTPIHLKPPAIVENVAKSGLIVRQLSKKRVSLVDEDLGFLDARKMSITDEILVEQAAVFDDMINKELKASDRRKSSLGLPAAVEVTKCEPEATCAAASMQDKRREIWKNKLRSSGKSLGKFYKPVVELSSSSDSSSDDEECDVNCHRKCQRLMPNLCGVNHKLVAEALSKLKKSRRSHRTSSTTCSTSSCSSSSGAALDQDGASRASTVSTSLSLSSVSVRNSSDSDSLTEGATGRVSPPAKTLPKFRTYSIKDFQFLKVLGKGSFGKVLLAELKGSECYYAVKCLKKDVVLEDDDVECTMIERKVLALGTGHPYFCHLFCTFQTQSHLFFVMEYLNGGDLMFHIQQSGRFDEGRARFYAAEIVCGLTFLHKWGIVYRDLKLDNILLDFDGHVRIADFGMCKLQIYLDKTTDTFCGTPDYMAPEIIKGLKYNQCVDWWSFGILLYEMLVGQSPFSGCDEDDLFWSICNMRPHFPRHLSNQAKSILNAFLEKDWTKRLGSSENSASDVMNHEFFSGLKWHLLERRQLEPPFKPNMRHPLDTKYFDRAFTSEKPVLTPVDPSILESMDQTQFQGFSYTNPNATE